MRIYELPPEYLYEPIIKVIASAIGSVVSIDERTKNREMLHYARVLVELYLRKDKEMFIMYKRSGHCSIVSIGNEQHPNFNSLCERLDQSPPECSRNSKPCSPPTQPKALLAKSGLTTVGTSRGNNDTNKEWIQVGPRNSVKLATPASLPMSSSISQANLVIPSTNAIVPYVTPTIATSNAFSVLHISNEDVQKDLLAHIILERQRDDTSSMTLHGKGDNMHA